MFSILKVLIVIGVLYLILVIGINMYKLVMAYIPSKRELSKKERDVIIKSDMDEKLPEGIWDTRITLQYLCQQYQLGLTELEKTVIDREREPDFNNDIKEDYFADDYTFPDQSEAK